MMYILLILFFTSLTSIIFMIGRKLFLLQDGQTVSNTDVPFEIPHLEKVKHFTLKNIKKYEHIILVEILRFYVRFANLLKNKYQELKIKIRNKIIKNDINNDKQEISNFYFSKNYRRL